MMNKYTQTSTATTTVSVYWCQRIRPDASRKLVYGIWFSHTIKPMSCRISVRLIPGRCSLSRKFCFIAVEHDLPSCDLTSTTTTSRRSTHLHQANVHRIEEKRRGDFQSWTLKINNTLSISSGLGFFISIYLEANSRKKERERKKCISS